jgi:general secretion pathway protein D
MTGWRERGSAWPPSKTWREVGSHVFGGTAVAEVERMRLAPLVSLLLLPTLAAAARPQVAAAPSPPGADAFLGCKKYPPEKKFKWSVRGEVGVGELAASLSEISCRPIVVATTIAQRGGKVVLEVPDLVSAADVYRLFYGALEAMGLTVDASGGTIKIVDAGRAREIATPELGDGGAAANGPADDRFVVRLVRPKHAGAAELAELLGKMKSKDGDVSVFGAASLVLIDRAVNVRRMEEVARALDIGEEGARIYTLETHGQSPTELVAALEKILQAASHQAGAATGDRAKAAAAVIDGDVRALVPFDSARLVALVGTDAGWQRVQAIAERLDPQADDGAAARGHVLPLLHTNAEDMAQTLQSVGLGSRGAVAGARPGASGAPSPSTAGSPLALSGDVRIGFDKASNALIVYANAVDFASVRDLVQRLDLPRRQVFVEAVVFDLSVDKSRTIGVSWHQGVASGNGDITGFAAGSSSSLVTFDAKSLAAAAAGGAVGGGLFAGVLGKSFQLFGQDIPSFGVALQALEHSKDANVISRPHLLTMDNVKASLSVGQVIPYPTQSLSAPTAATGLALSTTYNRQTVALTLELTPHLNDSSSIRLEINGTIEDVADTAASSGGGPTTNQRKLQTAVVVQDGECVVLGGLTKDSDVEAIDKIPFLGDIPLLGRLFQTRAKRRIKQDLLIVLTPYIIRGPDDVRRIQQQKEDERREFLERYSAFGDDHYEAKVDYRRKRGVLEEINVSAQAAARDAEALRAAERALKPRRPDGPIALVPAD